MTTMMIQQPTCVRRRCASGERLSLRSVCSGKNCITNIWQYFNSKAMTGGERLNLSFCLL